MVVGRWEDVRGDNATQELQEGPAQSGVFARVRRGGAGYEIDALDSQGRVVQTLGPGSRDRGCDPIRRAAADVDGVGGR